MSDEEPGDITVSPQAEGSEALSLGNPLSARRAPEVLQWRLIFDTTLRDGGQSP